MGRRLFRKEAGLTQYQPEQLSAEGKLRLQAHMLDAVEQAIMTVDWSGRIIFWNRFAEIFSGWTAAEVDRRSIDGVLGIPLMAEITRAEIAKGQDWSGEFLVQRRTGGMFLAHFSASLLQLDDQSLISIVGISREGSEPQTDQAVLLTTVERLKQSEATVQTLFRISNQLNATLEVDTILDVLALEAIQIVKGESGFAGLRTEGGMMVRKYFRRGEAIPFDYTWQIGEDIPGWVLANKVPYGTSDARQDPVIQHELAINAGVRSIICTPILDSKGEVLGYFYIRNKQNGEGFTIVDQDMLMALAPAASIAIQNGLAYQQRLATVAELKESARQLQALAASLESAREEERTRIARELHDQLGQALTAMKYDLAWLTDRLTQKDITLAEKAKTVTAQMDTMIKTVRRISTELRPGMLDDLGLAASIEWQAHDFEKRTGIICTVSVPADEIALTREQSIALYRVFQESLTNAARHAGAQLIEVTLEATPQVLTLRVQDDGRGILASEKGGLHSLGLLGMRERALRLGGAFNIHGTPGEGTTVTVSIPILLDKNKGEGNHA
jgi:PAS domain S-box-containing protein